VLREIRILKPHSLVKKELLASYSLVAQGEPVSALI
jgi:hypothetical protein